MKNNLLGITERRFLQRYWQKDLLLVRDAAADCADVLDRSRLLALATREDTQSRLVVKRHGAWHVTHGPLSKRVLSRLPASGWTILVQGVNHVLPEAAQLLQRFAFLPYARLDDVMASYAAPGGGVGPHFDSYDVFLLQGSGTRRWRVSAQRDLRLVENAPLRILKHFRAMREFLVEPGDLLYLPPRYAHDGVAVGGPCITYSVGFRAPSAQELGVRFLEFLQERLHLDGLYEDPDLAPARHPARITTPMVRRIGDMLKAIDWGREDIVQFAGTYLTEPKAHIVFERPARPLTRAAFRRAAQRHGIELALPTLMLFHRETFFINGEVARIAPEAARSFAELADQRRLTLPPRCDAAALTTLYGWYLAGYIRCT